MSIPAEVVDWFRDVFAALNRRLSEKIENAPPIPETHLDTTFIEHLNAYSSPRAFPTGWAIRIDTHYLGGMRHFYSWEIADLGVFVFFQQNGTLIRQKVALFQCKRLYPTAGDIDHLEEYDYRIGMARLASRDRYAPSMMTHRLFEFQESSRYQALGAKDRQCTLISDFIYKYHFPVYYLFYNPSKVPLKIQVPSKRYVHITADPPLGARVLPFEHVAKVLGSKNKGNSPSIADMAGRDGLDKHGWRLEHFMADLLLSCKQGRRFAEAVYEDLYALFNRRSGPIAATVAVTVEVPDEVEVLD